MKPSSLEQPLTVAVLPKCRAGLGTFRLLHDVRFDLGEFGETGIVVVPADYVTDLVSCPRVFRWYIPLGGPAALPALLHDQMCRENDRRATKIFNRALKAAGVGWWVRWPMVAFVAVFKFSDLYL